MATISPEAVTYGPKYVAHGRRSDFDDIGVRRPHAEGDDGTDGDYEEKKNENVSRREKTTHRRFCRHCTTSLAPLYTVTMMRLGVGRIVIGACQEAVAAARANRLRTGLAALATAAAVATMVLVVSGLDGVARYARETGERTFGSDTFVIAQVATAQLSRRELEERLARNPPVRRADTRFLDRVADDVVRYAPTAQRSAEAVAGNRSFENAAVNGTTSALPAIRVVDVAEGRFFTEVETTQAAQVAVIGADVADALFPGAARLRNGCVSRAGRSR